MSGNHFGTLPDFKYSTGTLPEKKTTYSFPLRNLSDFKRYLTDEHGLEPGKTSSAGPQVNVYVKKGRNAKKYHISGFTDEQLFLKKKKIFDMRIINFEDIQRIKEVRPSWKRKNLNILV